MVLFGFIDALLHFFFLCGTAGLIHRRTSTSANREREESARARYCGDPARFFAGEEGGLPLFCFVFLFLDAVLPVFFFLCL